MDCKAFPQEWILLEGGTTLLNLPWIVWTKRLKESLSRLMIKIWPMVRTEADMIVNHVNHHHIIHHQGILYNTLNIMKFSTKRNYVTPYISTMIMKIRWPMEGVGYSLILTLIEEASFLTLIGGTCFLILSKTKEENIQILMSFQFYFFF